MVKEVVCSICGVAGKFKNVEDMIDKGWCKIAFGENDKACDSRCNPNSYYFCEKHSSKEIMGKIVLMTSHMIHASSKEVSKVVDSLIEDEGRVRALKQRLGRYDEACEGCGKKVFSMELTFVEGKRICAGCNEKRMQTKKEKTARKKKETRQKKNPQKVLDMFGKEQGCV